MGWRGLARECGWLGAPLITPRVTQNRSRQQDSSPLVTSSEETNLPMGFPKARTPYPGGQFPGVYPSRGHRRDRNDQQQWCQAYFWDIPASLV